MASVRCVVHGGWLPADSEGRFVIWAEDFTSAAETFSDRTDKKSKNRKNQSSNGQLREHPFQLPEHDLVNVLKEFFNCADSNLESTSVQIVLPGTMGCPVPSLELQDESDIDLPAPEHWQQWNVDAVSIIDPSALLDSIDTLTNLPEIVIGVDLRFWATLSNRLNDTIRRHDYLPAIFPTSKAKARSKKSSSGRRKKTSSDVEFITGWELTDTASESIVSSFSTAMPGVCRMLSQAAAKNKRQTKQTKPQMLNAEELIRNFLASELNRRARCVRLPESVRNTFRGPFPGNALPQKDPASRRPYHTDRIVHPVSQTHWMQWRFWRNQINRSEVEADERISFRLRDPEDDQPDQWRLEWLLSSRRDPSYQASLTDFWKSQPEARSVREVLLQLGQAARLYERLWGGMNSDAPDGVVLTREQALEFLHHHAAVLQGAGFRVIVPSWWTVSGQRRLRLQMKVRTTQESEKGVGHESQGLLGMDAVVSWQPSVVMDGVELTAEEWEEVVKAKEGLVKLRGQWMELNVDDIAVLEQYWQQGYDFQETSFRELLHASADPNREVVYDDNLAQAMEVFRDSGSVALQPQPDTLSGELRNYQVRGYSWLSSLEELGFGACLADDMGLGKTIQVLAAVLRDKAESRDFGPTLLVAPTSVLAIWQSEARKFAPTLKTYIHHGSTRHKTVRSLHDAIEGVDLVIMSFGVVRSDKSVLNQIAWRRLVVDEAQNVKNPTAAITKALAAIPAKRRIALTGTPVENRLLDLWSIFNIVNPGFLGNVTGFRKEFEKPIMRDGSQVAMTRLREMVRPFILRRLKSDRSIISDLPDKIEQNSPCSLTAEQATLYEAVLREIDEKLKDEEGIQRQGIMLSALTRLKQVCNHPAQFLQDGSDFTDTRSHKLARVCEMLEEIHAEGENALVFTQFTEIGKSLQTLFRTRLGCTVYYLHGGTPMGMRQHMTESFQDPNTPPAVFVLSLRAAGVGLTLTRANHVIHFDRWWNPAVESQATDRAYRIGQTKVVMVHKMVTLGTLEEKIDHLIQSKRQLAEEVVGTGESWLSKMGNEDFKQLVSLDRENAVIG